VPSGTSSACAPTKSSHCCPARRFSSPGRSPAGATATLWSERVRLAGAEPVASYEDGPLAGIPAVTRHPLGDGTAWYLATRPDPATLAALLDRICDEAGVQPVLSTPPHGIEAVRRSGTDADYLFLIDHTGSGAEVPTEGVELLTGKTVSGSVTVPAGGVAVVREAR